MISRKINVKAYKYQTKKEKENELARIDSKELIQEMN